MWYQEKDWRVRLRSLKNYVAERPDLERFRGFAAGSKFVDQFNGGGFPNMSDKAVTELHMICSNSSRIPNKLFKPDAIADELYLKVYSAISLDYLSSFFLRFNMSVDDYFNLDFSDSYIVYVIEEVMGGPSRHKVSGCPLDVLGSHFGEVYPLHKDFVVSLVRDRLLAWSSDDCCTDYKRSFESGAIDPVRGIAKNAITPLEKLVLSDDKGPETRPRGVYPDTKDCEIAERSVYMPLSLVDKLLFMVNASMVGFGSLNYAHLSQWFTYLADMFSKGIVLKGTDVSCWDFSVNKHIMVHVVLLNLKRLGVSPDRKLYRAMLNRERTIMMKLLVTSDGFIWLVPYGLQISGRSETSNENSRVRAYYHMCAAHDEHIRCLGDDSVETFSEEIKARYMDMQLNLKVDLLPSEYSDFVGHSGMFVIFCSILFDFKYKKCYPVTWRSTAMKYALSRDESFLRFQQFVTDLMDFPWKKSLLELVLNYHRCRSESMSRVESI